MKSLFVTISLFSILASPAMASKMVSEKFIDITQIKSEENYQGVNGMMNGVEATLEDAQEYAKALKMKTQKVCDTLNGTADGTSLVSLTDISTSVDPKSKAAYYGKKIKIDMLARCFLK